MDQGTISLTVLVAWLLWAWVLVCMIAAWVVMSLDPGEWRFSGLLATTGCASSALAAVMHLRCYHLRLREILVERVGVEPPQAVVRHIR